MTQATAGKEAIMDRSNCCKLFAACFHEPEKDLFLEERVHDHLAELMSSLIPEAEEPARAMQLAFARSSQDALSVDYAALFVGPFELLAPPYGSVYLEKGYRVQGDSTIAVEKYYERHGFILEIQEPADHLAIELEFLCQLAVAEAQAMHDGHSQEALFQRQVQAEFFSTYMTWLPSFCERTLQGAGCDYYRALATALQMFYRYCQGVYAR